MKTSAFSSKRTATVVSKRRKDSFRRRSLKELCVICSVASAFSHEFCLVTRLGTLLWHRNQLRRCRYTRLRGNPHRAKVIGACYSEHQSRIASPTTRRGADPSTSID